MTIAVADLKFFQSERMTDNSDGGGQMTAVEIIDGNSNMIFDDSSDVDLAAGDLSMRKIYGDVDSNNADKYLDAGMVVFREPANPHVSCTLFSTGSFYDERADAQARLEQSIVRGARWQGWLWGIHPGGTTRALVIWQRPETELPSIGQTLNVVAWSAGAQQYEEYLYVSRITDTLRTIIDSSGPYQIREVTCELAEPLQNTYTGIEPSRYDPVASNLSALLYDTRYNPNAVELFGIAPTVADASAGQYTIKVNGLYSPIIPTALSETAIPDTTPGGDSPAVIGSNASTVSFITTAQCIKPNVGLYLGTACYPGTLNISVSGGTITDSNGVAKLAGTDIGTLDYGNGIVKWNDSCPNYGAASKTITYRPAARPLTIVESVATVVTAENRGYVWVQTLSPIPAPATLRTSYQVNKKWYSLVDQGGGLLAGVDSSYGSGTLNFTTGTRTISTGALPDVGSLIIDSYSVPTQFFSHGGEAVSAPVIRGQTAHGGVAPLTVSISWTVGATTYTSADIVGDGLLNGSGAGDGEFIYSTGEWWIRPTILPPKGTIFTVTYQFGDPIVETFANPAADGSGLITLTLAHTNILPRSVAMTIPVTAAGFAGQANLPVGMIAGDAALETVNAFATDDGAGTIGGMWVRGTTSAVGAAAYTAGWVSFNNQLTVGLKKPVYSTGLAGYSTATDGTVKSVYHTVQTGWSSFSGIASFISGTITVRYRTSNSNTSASEEFTLDQLEFDLTRGYSEQLVSGSASFTIGNSRYVDTAGNVYRDPAPDTGAGTLCGTIDRSSGRVRLSSWPAGGTNAVTLLSLLTQSSFRPLEEVVFRTPLSPLKPGVLQIRGTTLDGVALSKNVDSTGVLEDTDCTIRADFTSGVIRARFGHWVTDASLTTQDKSEPWYNLDARVDFAGTLKIWRPKLMVADSILYNAMAITTLPPDSRLLGINAARLPPDGKALIFRVGMLVLVHHTTSFVVSSLSPTQVIDCGRVRLYRARIVDAAKKPLDLSLFDVERLAGTIAMSPSLDLTGYTAPYTVYHSVADLARLVDSDINGQLTLNQPLSHTYPSGEARVSGVLYCGTLQARVSNLFAQTTWTNVWSDTRIGNAPLAQYNDTLFPLIVTNAGTYPDRYLFKFTNTTDFQFIGEHQGLIATGNINTDFAPVNPLTGKQIVFVDHRGWGSGWSSGYCLRGNFVGACYPATAIRAIQPSQPTGLDDSVQFLFIGNVNA